MQVADEEIVLVKRSASTFQCSLCPNKYWARLSITKHVRNVHKKNLAHNMVANWASSAAVNLEKRQVPSKTTFSLLLFLLLKDANINCSCSKFDEDYVTPKIQINDANELVELYSILTFAFSFRSKLFIWIL